MASHGFPVRQTHWTSTMRVRTCQAAPNRICPKRVCAERRCGDRVAGEQEGAEQESDRGDGLRAFRELLVRWPRPSEASRPNVAHISRVSRRGRDEMDTRPIDADNHYYEPLDAFTRHLPKKFRERGVRAVQEGKRVTLLIGGKVNSFVPNPTFDPIIVPGCLDPLFRGRIPEGVDPRTLMKVEPLRAEYRGSRRPNHGDG